ncbi:unnamed protein product [Tilletia controversa]|uniref:Protein-S-isoprenylcysteine O-methyltransferase n=3 Tax=Tilletia TaxID=13289 RepID=A0A8X7SZN6_9BASI|nr:hypothetical protein CF336_g1330 [Tilletia laevis]KAE8202120.1 hypothetical protein CF328_g2398 [Tilletia controversa]KAE8260587.1 hypothetical protein A4X03_0g3773 [Tilletia caries]KAE8208239.1 hypothetical protein CF335_g559 [Tilletia laevis]KAE8253291.1 hypothetical protein A4X06_0g1566 [Tilletia controversa]
MASTSSTAPSAPNWTPPAHPTQPDSSVQQRKTLLTPTETERIPPHLSNAALLIAFNAFGLGALAAWTLLPSLVALGRQLFEGSNAPRLVPVSLKQCASSDVSPWSRAQFGIYLGSWAIFHMLEFVITARYNPTRLYTDSFLLQNGVGYHIAHGVAVCEFVLEAYFFPCAKVPTALTILGLGIMLVGQAARSLAMVHAGNSFSHQVAAYKREDHVLVTTGVYAISRHPSYFGFFYWALGTQLMLANPISALGFVVVLYRFFSDRIQKEEMFLLRFFGKAYEDYRKRVPTLLPFI